jgi:hypothetical protein
MILTVPHLLACLVPGNVGIYRFSDVTCYGNPVTGPWLEEFEQENKTRFYASEVPVSGYALIAARQQNRCNLWRAYMPTADEEQRILNRCWRKIDRGQITLPQERI